MREARIACTVGGIFNSASGLTSLMLPLRTSAPSSSSTSTDLFHEERVALGLLDDQALERRQLQPSPSSDESISSALSLPSGSSRNCV